MYSKFIIDPNLFYLLKFLSDFDTFNIDKDISNKINELINLLENKLYSSLTIDKDIIDTEHFVVFYYEK